MNLRQTIRFYRRNLTNSRGNMEQHRLVMQFYRKRIDRKLAKIIKHFGGDSLCEWDWQESTFYHKDGCFYLSNDTLVMQAIGVILRGETRYISYWKEEELRNGIRRN